MGVVNLLHKCSEWALVDQTVRLLTLQALDYVHVYSHWFLTAVNSKMIFTQWITHQLCILCLFYTVAVAAEVSAIFSGSMWKIVFSAAECSVGETFSIYSLFLIFFQKHVFRDELTLWCALFIKGSLYFNW